MHIKKEAYDAVLRRVEGELASVKNKIAHNKFEFKKLVDEQTRLKRERGILGELLRVIKAGRSLVKEKRL